MVRHSEQQDNELQANSGVDGSGAYPFQYWVRENNLGNYLVSRDAVTIGQFGRAVTAYLHKLDSTPGFPQVTIPCWSKPVDIVLLSFGPKRTCFDFGPKY